jgi:hypothetical protein
MTRPWITEPGVYDLDEADYHADPVVGGSLSSSGARTLITRTPARYAWERAHGRPDTDAFDLGHAVHTVLLGVGAPIAELAFPDRRSKAYKQAAADARAAGEVPLLTAQADQAYAMAEAARAHPVVGPLLARPGRAEQSLIAPDPESGVVCRVRPDWLPDVPDGQPVVMVDLKTADRADPVTFARSMARYGYHQQLPFYEAVLRWLGRAPHGVQFVIVVIEKDPPYEVSYGWPDAEALEWGRVLNRRALDLYRECATVGHWPGYPPTPAQWALPGWQVRRYEDDYEAGLFDTAADRAAYADDDQAGDWSGAWPVTDPEHDDEYDDAELIGEPA